MTRQLLRLLAGRGLARSRPLIVFHEADEVASFPLGRKRFGSAVLHVVAMREHSITTIGCIKFSRGPGRPCLAGSRAGSTRQRFNVGLLT